MLIHWLRLARKPWLPSFGALALVLLLSACGGGGGTEHVSPTPQPQPQPQPLPVNVSGQGEFKEAVLLRTLSASDIAAALAAADNTAFVASPKYPVQAWRLNYQTLDGQGQLILASALAVLPQKPAGASSPVLSYQHPTLKHQSEAPSNLETLASPELLLASQGYIVLSADYVGYGVSKAASHPYLLAAPSAAAVTDMLTAASYWRQTQNFADNGQLFLTGYSEGGYVTMAAHRALQAGNAAQREQLVSVVAGAGPYDVGLTFDEALKIIRHDNPLIGALLQPGLLRYLGDSDRAWVSNELVKALLGSSADVRFMVTAFDNFLADDQAALVAHSNVNDWLPQRPLALFHGRDDQTVSYLNASTTWQRMHDKGAGDLVTLTDCQVQPADHEACALPYWQFMQATFAKVAKDL